MRRELIQYFSNLHESNGLLLTQAPTGYGKTYETVQAIFQYVQSGGQSQVLFVTNLLKNLPAEDLRKIYEKNGIDDRFDKEVLVLASTASTVEQAIIHESIPAEFQTDAYQELLSACKNKQRLEQQSGESSPGLTQWLSEQIRTKLEPQFRHALEAHLRKAFPNGPAQRREAIRSKKKYQWIAKFYPAVFWSDYKILLLSVKKLMARNVTLVEPSFDCLSDRMLKNRIVCIDEFDASRADILDSLIDQALKLRADYLQLFLQVYQSITTHQCSRELEAARIKYEANRTLTWDRLLQQAEKIYQDGALYYSMKTVDTGANKGRNFLFHDTSYHTVLNDNRTHIRAVCNEGAAQVQIHFDTMEEYNAHKQQPRIVLQTLLRRIHVFLQRFQRYVYGWASYDSKAINACLPQTDDLYTTAAAIDTIFHDYSLTACQPALMTGYLAKSEKQHAKQELIAPNLSFYETGFRLFEFIDDDHHRAKTYLQYLQMQNTPESILLYLCHRAKVVGLSATAALPTVLGNYDLRYIKEQLGDRYHELSAETQAHIRAQLQELWTPYRDGRIQLHLDVMDRSDAHLPIVERLTEIFSSAERAQYYARRFTSLGIKDYIQKRYCNLFTAMKAFWTHADIRSFLCLNQVLPKPGKAEFDENLLHDAFHDLQTIYAPDMQGNMTVLRSGPQFEADKESLLRDLQNGAKHFVLSSYQTLGAGQNLQYRIQDRQGFVLLQTDFDETDSRFFKKDFDALYLGDITHTIVNLNEEGPLDEKSLLRSCFQAECLYENDEISYQTLVDTLKTALRRFSGTPIASNSKQNNLRQSDSFYGQITRDVLQAVGRMGRTFVKSPNIYLFVTEKTLRNLSPACLRDCILSPEMEALRTAREEFGHAAAPCDHLHNEAERKATKGKEYILRMLSTEWTEDSMQLWRALRQTVLQHPRADRNTWEQSPIIRAYYIPLSDEQHCYYYAQKGDFSQVTLSHGQSKTEFAVSLPEGQFACTVSAEDARLALLLSYPGMCAHFIEQGYATSFTGGPYILSPVLFQNIYKGALGEVAGWFILQRELGLCLQEIEDPSRFELFDFTAQNHLYFDFKHWKANMQMDEGSMRSKILQKLDQIGGKRAFIINLFSDGSSEPTCTNDQRLIEVPGLLLPNGQVDPTALAYIERFLL